MKKILLTILVFALLAGTTACTANLFSKKSADLGGNNGITYNKVEYTVIEDESLIPAEIKELIAKMEDRHYSQVFNAKDGGQYVYIQLGARNSAGYGIKVTSVEDVEGRISVVYQETRPEPGSLNATVITYPYIILKVDSELPVDTRETINSEQEAPEGEADILFEVIDDVNILPADVQAVIKFYENPVTEVIRVKDEQYVFISLGMRPTGGYGITVTGVKDTDGKLVVSYEEFKPGPDDIVTEALTSPWIVIRTSVLPVEFVKVN